MAMNNTLSAKKRKIAMTDIETSGVEVGKGEILEIGLIVFDQQNLQKTDAWQVKVAPTHIESALPEALMINGYTAEKWQNAITLKEAMQIYAEKTRDTIFCAYNATFDWVFLCDAFQKTGISNPMNTTANHDRLDLLSIAWSFGLNSAESFSLKSACEFFGVPPEPVVHSAFKGTETAYELYKKIILQSRKKQG